MFAIMDDAILFCTGKKLSVIAAKAILLTFEGASGLRINFHKSSMVCINMLDAEGESFALLMNCKRGVFPFTYLGLPLYGQKMPKYCWLPLLEKLCSRLAT